MSFPFEIGGVPLDGSGTLPSISYEGASFTYTDVESSASGVNQLGTQIRDKVSSKIVWSIEFAPMTQAKLGALLTAVDASSFQFTCPNIFYTGGVGESTTTTITACVKSRTAPIWTFDPHNGKVAKWGNVSFDIEEL